MTYEPVIGLEVHVQLKTRTKVFCGCANQFGCKENTNICPVCLGLPGSLPVLNAEALKNGARVGLALNCHVRPFIKFDRKNYFYPDLPKNFQISQFDMPIAENGYLEVDAGGERTRIRIKRVHLEEDAGKLIHPESGEASLVDFNRAGTPLLEIVTEPDIHAPDEAYQYLTDLKLILQYLDVSDCDMEKGSLRCDANVSVRPQGETKLGTKAELKNMNSFKAVRSGLSYEIKRQTEQIAKGERIVQETRLWDEKTQKTISMRSKEEAHDYRYFPEPDLPPFTFSDEEVARIRGALPELPKEKIGRFVSAIGLTPNAAAVLVSQKPIADFFENSLKLYQDAPNLANWMIGPVLSQTDSNVPFTSLQLTPEGLTHLISLVDKGAISNLAGKTILAEMVKTGQPPDKIIDEKGLSQVSDQDQITTIMEDVIAKNKKSVDDYLAGKENALMFLVGQVMKASGGRANPKVAKELLARRLSR